MAIDQAPAARVCLRSRRASGNNTTIGLSEIDRPISQPADRLCRPTRTKPPSASANTIRLGCSQKMVDTAGAKTAAAARVAHHHTVGTLSVRRVQTTLRSAAQAIRSTAMKIRADTSNDAAREVSPMTSAKNGVAVHVSNRCGWPLVHASTPP